MTTNIGVRHTVQPALLWAVHWILIYALLASPCTERAVLSIETAQLVALASTVLTALVVVYWLIESLVAYRRLGSEDECVSSYTSAAASSALISLIAIVANLWPLAAFTHCSF